MEDVAAVASSFHMDPALVLRGDDWDVAVRLAAERVHGRLLKQALEEVKSGVR